MIQSEQCSNLRFSRLIVRENSDSLSVNNKLLWFITLLCGMVLLFWLLLDHSWPEWDAAEHIYTAERITQLLRHPHPLHLGWMSELLSQNHFYPPAVYWVNGLLKLALGSSRWVDKLSLVLFDCLLTASMYCLTLRLISCRIAAAASAIFVNCYPISIDLGHRSLLEFPLFSIVTATMVVLILWYQDLTWSKTLLLGFMLGLCLLCKQIAAFFLVGPLIYFMIRFTCAKQNIDSLKLLTAICFAVIMFLPWYCVNATEMFRCAQELNAPLASRNIFAVFYSNAVSYLRSLPALMSPIQLIFFLVSCLCMSKIVEKIKVIFISACVGALLLCTLPWTESRYLLSFLILPAIVSGHFVSHCWHYKKPWLRVLSVLIMTFSLMQLMIIPFCPSPALRALAFGQLSVMNPMPAGDLWGQEWVISTISQASLNKSCYLDVLPSTRHLNVHTLQMVARAKKSTVLVTTNRAWTTIGDQISSEPEQLRYYDWFLLKSGDQGFKFANEYDSKQFELITNYITNNSQIGLYKSHRIADGSIIYLYRRKV